jgi:hypothetical protein
VAIQGSIEEAGLPDVLQLLALGRKTGCLSVVDGSELQGQIFLDVGRVSYATVSSRPDRLGDMLVKSGRITRQQLDQAVAEQSRTSDHQIGRILVDAGRLERAELEHYIRLQVEEAVYFLFTWKQGTFSFTSERLPPYLSLLVPLDTESLLLEGARRVDEWSLIQRKIPSFDLVYRRTRDTLSPAVEGLTEEQKRILGLLDGAVDVNGLVDATGMAEFDVGKALYGLVTAGLVQLVERRAHVRHLEYRELLAYAVREAEFADAQRRKDAARHIVDCPICAERLRTMHIRSTTGATPVPRAAVQSDPVQEGAASAPAGKRAAATGRGGAPVGVERRARERRAGSDRRKHERRTGIDRRRAVGVARPQAGVERRVGPRREEDLRTGDAHERRAGERIPRSDVTAPAAAASVGGTAESGGPQPLAARGDTPLPAAGPPASAAAVEVEPAVAKAEVSAPGADAKAQVATASPAPPREAPAQTGGAPAAARQDAPGEIEWVVSPEESLELLRGSRTSARGSETTRRGKSPAPGIAGPANHARPPAANGASGAASPGAGARDALAAGGPTLDRYAAGSHQARAAEARKRADEDAERQAYPVKRLAIAAGIVFVAVLGFMAGQLGSRGGRSQIAAATAAGEGSPAAESLAVPAVEVTREPSRVVGEPAPAESVTQGAAAPRASPAAARTEVPSRRSAEPAALPRERPRPAAPAPPAPTPTQPVASAVEVPPAAPTVGIVRGVVHDAGGRVVPGARVSVRGTALSAVTDGSGAFEIRDVPGGPATVLASADGFVAGSADVRVQAGAETSANLALSRPVAAAEPDEELAAGGWAPVDRAEAASILGGTLGAIEGLPIESISKSTAAGRARVRVAQLTQAGQRIVLTETRAGAAVRAAGPVVVTALRVIPPSDAYPWSTATASFGNVLITVKTSVAVDALRSMLARLSEVTQNP